VTATATTVVTATASATTRARLTATMASQLATQGYRIAKSWQYQENLPEPASAGVSAVENNNSLFVSSSLNPVRAAAVVGAQTDGRRKNEKIFGIFPNFFRSEAHLDGDPHLQKPLLFPEYRRDKNKNG